MRQYRYKCSTFNSDIYAFIRDCHCHTCNKDFNHLGINRHRAMHRDKRQYCEITYSDGNKRVFHFERKENKK